MCAAANESKFAAEFKAAESKPFLDFNCEESLLAPPILNVSKLVPLFNCTPSLGLWHPELPKVSKFVAEFRFGAGLAFC